MRPSSLESALDYLPISFNEIEERMTSKNIFMLINNILSFDPAARLSIF